MRIRSLIVMAALAASYASDSAAFQVVGRSNQPITVVTGRLTNTPGRIELEQDVELTQGDARLRASRITVDLSADGAFRKVTAVGDVYYVTPKQTIRADRAEYQVSTAEIVASGDVILTQGESVLAGGRLVYNVDTESARMDGQQPNGRRVQGVFYPEGNN